MWERKYERDEKLGVDSPMPTQVISNEEFIPRPQNRQQKQVEHLIGQMATENARRINMDRRDFLRSSMGLATVAMAMNTVYGSYWEVQAEEVLDPAVTAEKFPKGEYFIVDAQAHFTNGYSLGFRDAEFVKNMGFQLEGGRDAYGFQNFVKEMLFDSETSIVIISGVPDKEKNKDEKTGKILEGMERSKGFLPSWLMARAKREINEIAGCKRAFSQGNCAPNHYWDKVTDKQDLPALFDQMEREVKLYEIDSWKWYCHTDPGRSGRGFQLDDEMSANFYAQSRKLGIRNISCHKGFSYQSRTLGHLANPQDVEKAALENPDFNFIIYHSALKHGPNEPDYEGLNKWDPETGDFEWHRILMDIKKRNPAMTNVYPEIGSSFGLLAIAHPAMAQHLMGKNIKYYGVDHVIWGTDCLWWGSPQWAIDLFKRFQFTPEMQEKFGYAPLTKEDKAKIFGQNIAKLYNIDVNQQLKAIPGDALSKLKNQYLALGGQRTNRAPGWVRAETA